MGNTLMNKFDLKINTNRIVIKYSFDYQYKILE